VIGFGLPNQRKEERKMAMTLRRRGTLEGVQRVAAARKLGTMSESVEWEEFSIYICIYIYIFSFIYIYVMMMIAFIITRGEIM